jgi:hypothetical protein
MRRHVFTQKPIIDYFKQHFLNFEVDVESSVDLTDFDGNTLQEKIFAQRHNLVGATPVLAFFDLKGKRVVSRFCFVANSSACPNVSGFGNSSACMENDKNSQIMSKDFILHYLCLRL